MKKYILTFLLLSVITLVSQDKEPNHWEFFHSNNTTKQTFEPDSLKQTRIYTGFQWNYSHKMNDALQNTSLATGTYQIPEVAPEDQRII